MISGPPFHQGTFIWELRASTSWGNLWLQHTAVSIAVAEPLSLHVTGLNCLEDNHHVYV